MKIYPPGTRIAGRYEIVGQPLKGGMGIVYLCFDHQDQRPVVLKTFRSGLLPDQTVRDRFLREGTAWVNLGNHPHIVRAYGVERLRDGQEVYLVLELVAKEPGREDASLRSWLTPGVPLPIEQALLFALQIARGMAHATDVIQGLVHRDLKPENVLIGADRLSNAEVNRLCVTDFGLAAVVEAAGIQAVKASEASTGRGRTQLTRGIVGTPSYMAPEQWLGEPTTAATDIYALGCVLFEMLAGRRAAAGSNLTALEQAHCQGRLGPLPVGLPAQVTEIVSRCLVVRSEARYGDWAQVVEALINAFGEVTGRAAPEPEPVQLPDPATRVAAGWSYSEMGYAYLDMGKPAVAVSYFERALQAGREWGDQRLEAAGLTHLGLAHSQLGDPRRAVGHHEQALAIHRQIGDREGEGVDLVHLGNTHRALGNSRRAIKYHEQALAILRKIGDRRREEATLGSLGLAYSDLGDQRQAEELYERARTIARGIGHEDGVATHAFNLALMYARRGQLRQALPLAQEAAAIWGRIDSPHAQQAQRLANQLRNMVR
jgi:serine/threonine protein kinase